MHRETTMVPTYRGPKGVLLPRHLLSVAAVAFLMLLNAPWVAPQYCAELVGRWPYGQTFAVAFQRPYVVFHRGAVLVVADVSDPGRPVELSETALPDDVGDLAIRGDYVYVTLENGGLLVIDISSPGSPVVVGSAGPVGWGYGTGVTLSGTYAYLTDYQGLRVFDVSIPTAPVFVGGTDLTGHTEGVAVAAGYAYVITEREGLRVVDVGVPSSPRPTTFVDSETDGSCVLSSGSLLLAGYIGSTRLFDISTAGVPVEVGSFPRGAMGLAVAGDRAYVSSGDVLALDISNPSAPKEIGFSGPRFNGVGIAADGSVVFLAARSDGLRVFDFSQCCATFAEVAYVDTVTDAVAVVARGAYVYAAGEDGTVHVVDVLDPDVPFRVGLTRTTAMPYAMTAAARFIYVATANGIDVIDVVDPAAPVLAASVSAALSSGGIEASGSYVFAASEAGGLLVFDVSNPLSPAFVGATSGIPAIRGLAVAGDHAFMAAGGAGLIVIDIADPARPVVAAEETTLWWDASAVAVALPYAYLGGGEGLEVLDISDPESPSLVGWVAAGGFVTDLAVHGSYVFATDGGCGVLAFDVSDPTRPRPVGRVTGADEGRALAVSGDHAYVVGPSDYFRVFNIAPCCRAPAEIAHLGGRGLSAEIGVSQGLAFLSNVEAGFRVIDVSDPSTPFEIGALETVGYAFDVAVSGQFAYVADGPNGVGAVDIATASAPRMVSRLRTIESSVSVAVSGSTAFVAAGPSGLLAVDVSDPTSLSLAGAVAGPFNAAEVAVSGTNAYVAGLDGGLRIIDIHEPHTMQEVGSLPGYVDAVAMNGSFAYVGGSAQELRIVDVSDPTSPVEIGRPKPPVFGGRLAVSGSTLLAGSGTDVRIFDVSNPLEAKEIHSMTVPDCVTGITITGPYAYVSEYRIGFEIYDVSMCCTAPPSRFDLLSPPDGAFFHQSTITLDWQDSPGALYYDVFADTSNPPLTRIGAAIRGSELGFDATPYLTYFWRVVAINGCGTAESLTESFRVVPYDILRYENKASLVAAIPDSAFLSSGGLPWLDPEDVLSPTAPPLLFYDAVLHTRSIALTRQGATIKIEEL